LERETEVRPSDKKGRETQKKFSGRPEIVSATTGPLLKKENKKGKMEEGAK